MQFKYEYTRPDNGERQYNESIPFNSYRHIDARYVKSAVSEYNGNPFIEALPHPRTKDEIEDAYSKSLISFNWEKAHKMNMFDKVAHIALLKDFRVQPVFATRLETQFYYSQIVSYNNRNSFLHSTAPFVMKARKDDPDPTPTDGIITLESCGSSPNEPITLLGYSGCGKTSAIKTLLTDYPQVLVHEFDDDYRFLQITYIYVECPANSNIDVLFSKIAEQIDLCIGSGTMYRDQVEGKKKLGQKAQVISRMFKAFGVGTLFIDEIQNMDFTANKEASFVSLMTISNDTGTNVSVIGTEEAYRKMFGSLKQIRRTGAPIIASEYCSMPAYLSTCIMVLSQYQWFDEQVTFTDKMLKTMQDCTGGIFDQIVTLYTFMNLDYLEIKEANPSEKIVVDEKYILETSNRHFPGLQEILKTLEVPGIDKKLKELRQSAEAEKNRIMERARMEKEAEEIIENNTSEKKVERETLVKNCVVNILKIHDDEYSAAEIEKEVRRQIRKNKSGTEKAITKLAYRELKNEYTGKIKAIRAKKGAKNDAMKEAILKAPTGIGEVNNE